MNKVIFFDADGVTIEARKELFSDRLARDYGVPADLVIPLFKNEFYKCVVGEMDLSEVLEKYIPIWGWTDTVDELLAYWWAGEGKENTSVLELISELRSRGVKCYLATDQVKERADFIMKEMGFESKLDGAFFSSEIGLSKASVEYWKSVLSKLGIEDPSEVIYWDDEQENVDAAKEVGIDAHLYTGISDLDYLK